MRSLFARTVLSVAIIALALPCLPLLAQDKPAETKKADDQKKAEEEKKPKVTEEMVVTARKREETVQEVPISVAAPTESELRDRGAQTIEDVAANVAGFTVQNLGPGQSQVAMRGVSAGQIVRDQPGVKEQVGVYLDESVISLSLFTPDVDLFDVNRVEVLRGPQGTLFGSGSLSGTVRYITNQPQLKVQESIGELSANTIEGGGPGGSIKVAVNAPFGDTAAMRFAGYYTTFGGFTDAIQPNLSIQKNVNDGYRGGARLAFLYKPNDKFSIVPRLLYQRMEMNGWNREDAFNILANPYTTTRPPIAFADHQIFTQFEEPYKDRFTLADVTVSYDLMGKKLTSVSSMTDRNVDVLRDATALTASITGGSIGLPAKVYTLDAPLDDFTRSRSYTEELRLSGNMPKVQWVVGGFYGHQQRNYGQNLLVNGFQAATGIPTKGSVIAPTDGLFWSDLHYKFRQTALFGEATYAVNDRFDLTGGLRVYSFKEDRVQTFDGIFADPGTSRGSTKADGIAPRVMASFKLNDSTRVNGQIAKGFRLGGINDPLNVPLCTPQDLVTFGGHGNWKDETLWNYEVGSKSRIMAGRGTLNVSAFYADISDLQATVTAGSCSSRVIFNVPKARSTGVEGEIAAAPNDNFDVSVAATFVNAKLRSTLTSTDSTGHTTVVAGIESGHRLPTVPQIQVVSAATLRWPSPSGFVAYATGVFQHVGDRYTQIGDQAAGFGTVNLLTFSGTIGGPLTSSTFTFNPKLPAYDVINIRVGVLKNRWDTAIYVNNASNTTALLGLDQERGTRARVGFLTNQPRTIGVSTRVNF